MTPQLGDRVFRALGHITWYDSLFGHSTPGVSLSIETYQVLKLTPRGFWIGSAWPERWCGHTTRYVAATEAGAIQALVERKAIHVKHAKRRFQEAEAVYKAAKEASKALQGGSPLQEIAPTLKTLDW